jgi:hypothetical protein
MFRFFATEPYELPKKVCQNSDKAIKEVESKNADNRSCQNSDTTDNLTIDNLDD